MAYKRSSVLVGLPDQDREWEQVQAKTFTKWLNTKLHMGGHPPMSSLSSDLSNGVRLIQLMEIMGDTSLGRYYQNPRMRVQMAENVNKALEFIRGRGVVLTNVGAEDIIDGNLKLILGMIWTLILRFTIADISEEGVNAKEGLLLWCQRKTAPYDDVSVNDFSHSWKSGLALCALIHRHRPDLLDYHALPKHDAHACTSIAFRVAQQHLGIPQLLDVEDLCDAKKPDERSVMTYVAQYFHAFSTMEQAEVVSRRVATFAEVMQSAWMMKNEYEDRAQALLDAMSATLAAWSHSRPEGSYASARALLSDFNAYKSGLKRTWVQERTDLTALLGNIQTKLKTYNLREWRPREGLRQRDVDAQWAALAQDEVARSRMINQSIREAKEALRFAFAQAANGFEEELRRISSGIARLKGDLEKQRTRVEALMGQVEAVGATVGAIEDLDRKCQEANVEENDHTVFNLEDLRFELELVRKAVANKGVFIENQIISRQHTNLTPAQLEEFESTFRYFDKDGTGSLTLSELGAAMASLGMVYTEEDIAQIYMQLEAEFPPSGAASGDPNESPHLGGGEALHGHGVSYDAFLSFLREITEDTTSPDQLLEAFHSLAGEKPYVTELDLRMALLPQSSIDHLKGEMPELDEERRQEFGLGAGAGAGAEGAGAGNGAGGGHGGGSAGTGENGGGGAPPGEEGKAYDYEAYLHGLFAGSGAGHDADNSVVLS